MLKIRRLYNQNRKGIWLGASIVAFLIIILQLVNWMVANQSEKESEENLTVKSGIVKNENNITIESRKSSVSGENINTNTLKKDTDAIKEFINNCKESKIEEAYNMLTEECKEEMYPSIEIFNEIYYSKIFANKNISCTIENWHGNIYKVDISINNEDILSTGKISGSSTLQDYITVKKDNDGYKLNINGYIGRENLEKKKEDEKYTLTVVQRDIYMNYEKYTLKIKNNSDKEILLDTMRYDKSMYIEDNSVLKYGAYNHELTNADLNITAGNERVLTIKYYSSYNSGKNIKFLVFSDVIFNYDSKNAVLKNYEVDQIKIAL